MPAALASAAADAPAWWVRVVENPVVLALLVALVCVLTLGGAQAVKIARGGANGGGNGKARVEVALESRLTTIETTVEIHTTQIDALNKRLETFAASNNADHADIKGALGRIEGALNLWTGVR